ncbi:MAG: hypothetical protein ABL935_09570, partial [Nitrospiraceae bacterium]
MNDERGTLSDDRLLFHRSSLILQRFQAGWFFIQQPTLDVLDLPINGIYPGIEKIAVDLRETAASVEFSDGQWRRMCASNHGMVRLSDQWQL